MTAGPFDVVTYGSIAHQITHDAVRPQALTRLSRLLELARNIESC